MSSIPLITYEYLLGAVPIKGKPNNYFGSVTLTEPAGLFDDAFRYRLTVAAPQSEEEEIRITAEWYLGWQAYDIVDKEKIKKEVFEASEEGAAAANRWLCEALASVK
ncbi:MAG: hypothetical protein IJU96_09305 [Clostridia bacterium]|nr:hypothetical protein [Clostridia bacterium]